MDVRFGQVTFDDIAREVSAHLAALPSAIDPYLEERILASRHYRIVIGGEVAGFASIHEAARISQFALAPAFRRQGQAAF